MQHSTSYPWSPGSISSIPNTLDVRSWNVLSGDYQVYFRTNLACRVREMASTPDLSLTVNLVTNNPTGYEPGSKYTESIVRKLRECFDQEPDTEPETRREYSTDMFPSQGYYVEGHRLALEQDTYALQTWVLTHLKRQFFEKLEALESKLQSELGQLPANSSAEESDQALLEDCLRVSEGLREDIARDCTTRIARSCKDLMSASTWQMRKHNMEDFPTLKLFSEGEVGVLDQVFQMSFLYQEQRKNPETDTDYHVNPAALLAHEVAQRITTLDALAEETPKDESAAKHYGKLLAEYTIRNDEPHIGYPDNEEGKRLHHLQAEKFNQMCEALRIQTGYPKGKEIPASRSDGESEDGVDVRDMMT